MNPGSDHVAVPTGSNELRPPAPGLEAHPPSLVSIASLARVPTEDLHTVLSLCNRPSIDLTEQQVSGDNAYLQQPSVLALESALAVGAVETPNGAIGDQVTMETQSQDPPVRWEPLSRVHSRQLLSTLSETMTALGKRLVFQQRSTSLNLMPQSTSRLGSTTRCESGVPGARAEDLAMMVRYSCHMLHLRICTVQLQQIQKFSRLL